MRHLILIAALGLCACGETENAASLEADTEVYGNWPSPVSAESVVAGSRSLSQLDYDNGYVYWVESRPDEGGRNTLMRWKEGQGVEQLLDAPWNVRTRVHEYGGLSYVVADGEIWFSNFSDQQLYRLVPGGEPKAFTNEEKLRYAACEMDRPRERLVCVREDHRGDGEPVNALVALPLDAPSEASVLFDDSDFVSAPSLSPDGNSLAFVAWDHPNMPWDNTSLYSAQFDPTGKLTELQRHNPGQSESVVDPQWGPDNRLYALSDRDNWWKIYRVEGETFSPLQPQLDSTEIGGPAWTLGRHYYRFLEDGRILAVAMRGGVESLVLLNADSGTSETLPLDGVAFGSLASAGEQIFIIIGPKSRRPELVLSTIAGDHIEVIRTAGETDIDKAWIPDFRLVSFPTTNGETAHGIYLPPTNPDVEASKETAPPLMVTIHGGPTSVSSPEFSFSDIFWTSRGFAILKVNYRGSTGFGRDYRQALYGKWGESDVEDAIAGARWAAESGLADPEKLIIRGGSAGGFTTLAALAFYDTFATGASYYGVSDLEALARETHKFESRYLDTLVGPYPEKKAVYQQRSPINHLEGFKKPLLLLQGLDDRVVPPNQSEMIFEALKAKGVPTAYLAFPGEAHGFRKAENRIRALQAELLFYSRVMGIEPSDKLPPLDIIGLENKLRRSSN